MFKHCMSMVTKFGGDQEPSDDQHKHSQGQLWHEANSNNPEATNQPTQEGVEQQEKVE